MCLSIQLTKRIKKLWTDTRDQLDVAQSCTFAILIGKNKLQKVLHCGTISKGW